MSLFRAVALIALLSPAAQALNLASLLSEMVDRDALARLPEPAYTCRQFSSYDRAAKDPEHDWFANGDVNQYLRVEERDGRKEWVMMDAAGPGAIVRLWSANPPGDCRLRFYFDEQTEPGWTVDFQALTNGKGPVAAPLSAVRSRGWNCYLPVPYAKHCKVTADKPGFYYQVNYRTWPAGTAVETFTPAALDAAKAQVDRVQAALANPPAPTVARKLPLDGTLAAKQSRTVNLPAGTNAVRQITLNVAPVKADADLAQVLRSVVVRAEFDGEACIWVPLSDFFGSGVGVNAYQDWYCDVAQDGTMTCRWVMPYQKAGRLTIENLGALPVTVKGSVGVGPFTWDARSMHFRSEWRWQNPLPTRPYSDWNYVTVTGQGVYVGDALAVFNPVTAWWGEGDEKVYVDGEAFPSHFGTGSEDYYGYAWCDPTPFTAPFHAQPRCDGPANRGNTTVTRVRSLDAIPFSKSLRFDMECWHWADCKVAYAATTYWYGRPGAKSNRVPQPDGALAALPAAPPPFKLAGAVEAEKMKIASRSDGLESEVQGTEGYGEQWSGGHHLWVRGRKVGDFVELELPADGAGARQITYYGTKSWDYGVLKITVNGQKAIDSLDTWAEQVTPTGALPLGTFEPVDGRFVVRVEVVGKNDKSKGTGSFFGIDALTLNKP
ncbi:MAG: DUF2961 domain-containing protein [Armatimonadetes bacterium]|nr:DUF2961 domain-containing protein [Armatimonadota bacterium]